MASERELLNKSIEIISKAHEEGIPVRLLGGLAVAYLAPNGRAIPEFSRESNDIDLFSLSSHSGKLSRFLKKNGIVSDSRFNALHGVKRQQYFYGETKVDLLLDEFRMCHRLPLKSRLSMANITIPPSDLLLTKLQIYEINEKDIKDILALLHDLKMGNADTHTSIDAGYIADLLSNDWGLYRTVTMNLEKVNGYLESTSLEPKKKRRVSEEIEYLKNAIELRPKSIGWKLRARVGDKVRWYELPEEVEYIVPGAVVPEVKVFEENGHIYQWMSFLEMQELSKRMSDEILDRYGKPKAILYIERGGMVLAQMLSDSLGVDEMYGLQIVAYEDINQMGKLYILPHYITLELKSNEYVLLVDDFADSGKTLKAAAELFRKKYKKVVTTTLAYKSRSIFKPDVFGKHMPDNAWIVFDYEETEDLESFRRSDINGGLKLLEYAKSEHQAGFDEIKKKTEELAKGVLKGSGQPAAILYMTRSGLIIARLLSDYLSVKRVSSIMPNKYITGDYMQHVANVCSKALADNPSGYILLVDAPAEGISAIKVSLSEKMPDIKLLTAAIEKPKKGHNIDFYPSKQ
ncbi:Phosphoribosyltransferase domain protein [mine drainage metagenome]|uniref:Phosphoribosyltransferase domain protein n=1 Tax=mine drainage metagenome TaxID=410659 RepID=T1AYA0_9ZZZZ